MNILMTSLSLITREQQPLNYNIEDKNFPLIGERTVRGSYTNEAPAYYLVREIYRNCLTMPDKVFVLSSTECANNKISFLNGITTEEWYRRTVLRIMEELNSDLYNSLTNKNRMQDMFVFINIDTPDTATIIRKIKEIIPDFHEAVFFMDFTGGSRVVAMMSIIILRWLESGGASVKRIVYGDYNSTPKKITDITDKYRAFEAIIKTERFYHSNEAINAEEVTIENQRHGFCYEDPALDYIPADVYDGASPYIFFSYCHKNQIPAQAVIKKLQSLGYRIWYDQQIDPGSHWNSVIMQYLSGCSCFIAFLSREYLESDYCKLEVQTVDYAVPVIPVQYDADITIDDLPSEIARIGNYQFIDAYAVINEESDLFQNSNGMINCKGE